MPITKVRTPSGEIVQVSHPEGATDEEIISYAKANAQPQPKEQAAPKAAQMPETLRAMSNLVAGGIRGAGSIGATLLASPAELRQSFLGQGGADAERRKSMDDALQSFGFDPSSGWFKGGKLAGEVGGTAGVGPAASILARSLGAGPAVVQALSTAGMTTGRAPATVAGKAADMAMRSAAGGVVGAGSAGLVSPEEAGTGGMVGAALPPALKAAGLAGRGVGAMLRPDADRTALAQKAISAGIPLGASDVSGNAIMKGARSFLDDVPVIGRIGAGRKEAVQKGFNKAIGDTFGAADDRLTPDVMDAAKKRLGAEFDKLWGRNTLQYDAGLFQDLQTLRANAQKLPQGESSRLMSWIDDIESKMVPDAAGNMSMPGDVANRMQSKLGRDVSSATGFLKNDLESLRRSLLSAFNRGVSPADAAALTKARGQYKAFKTVEPLMQKAEAGTAGRTVGDVPAALLPEAVRSSYKAGIASSPFADLSQIGSQFVADRVARTGGSGRAMIQNSALGTGLMLGGWSNPLLPIVGIPSAAAMEAALSSPALARMLVQGGRGGVNPLESLIYRSAPVLVADQ